jgi:peptide/nickel transport system substrate-binding protein
VTLLCPGGPNKAGGCDSYKGPYRDNSAGHLGLSTIDTPDDNHIVFHLNRPFSEFNYLAAEFATSPVEAKIDQVPSTGGNNYNTNVQATGPYRVASYVPNKHIILVRNVQWARSTDNVRTALPNTIVVTTNYDAAALDKDLIDNTVDLNLGGGVQPATVSRVLHSPSLLKRTVNPLTGSVGYLVLMEQSAPFDNVHCRRAIEWIVNRPEYLATSASSHYGVITTTMAPPTLAGYRDYDAYPTKGSAGSVDKAKSELKACGEPNGFSTTVVGVNTGWAPLLLTSLSQDLKKINIKVQVKTFASAADYLSAVGVPDSARKHHYGIALASWRPDWPAGYGYFEDILDPRKILPQSNFNVGECDLTDARGLEGLIDRALSASTMEQGYGYWRQFDERVVGSDACVVPLYTTKAVELFSSRVTNVSPSLYNGLPDLRIAGVTD